MTLYTFARGLAYANVVAASDRVAWTVDDVFGQRGFDAAAFDDLVAIGGMVDGVFAAQARAEAETLAAVRGRALSDEQSPELIRALHASLAAIMSGVGLGHPSFALVARELSPEGAAKLGIA